LRVCNIIRQMRRSHNLLVCSIDVPEEFESVFISYPSCGRLKKLDFFKNLIKKNNINTVLIATEMEIKLPVFLKFFCGVKIVIDIHGLYAEELRYKGSIGLIKKFLSDKIVKFYLYFYDLVLVCADKLKDYYDSVNPNIEIIYGGVNLKEFEPSSVKKTEIFTIGYMGNDRPYQGLGYLLQAAVNIKQKKTFPFKLNLVLSDKNEEAIKDKFKKLNIFENISLSCNVEHSKVDSIIKISDVLVIPRPSVIMTEYAFPSKLPEYLATGIPIIITNVGPVKTFLKIKEACIVIPSENITKHLEETLYKVYSMNSEERNTLRKKSLRLVETEFNWDTLGGRLNEFLEIL